MKIYIPTMGRVDRQRTLSVIPDKFDVSLVVDHIERNMYKEYTSRCEIIVTPKTVTDIGATRKFITKLQSVGNIVMLDDDLQFYRRKPDGYLEGNLGDIQAQRKITGEALSLVSKTLSQGFAHCGISAREGNNRVSADYVDCTRMLRLLAYDAYKLKHLGIKFDRISLMEDFDVTLQLLTKGCPNRVFYNYAQGQRVSNESGGCSSYRVPELQTESAHKLKQNFPDFVDVVQKETKVAWGGGTRTDVRIKWKKAYLSSKEAKT